jgi:diguanylate cyclase (GGDEF)-like protein/PAS domain S-box-containing protein
MAQRVAQAASQVLENVQLYAAVQQELAERKRAEAALRDSERKYRQVVDNSREVIFQIDLESRWSFLNPAWSEIMGLAPADAIGTPVLDYVVPEDRQHQARLFRMLISAEVEFVRHEARLLARNDEIRWLEVHARLTRDDDGRTIGVSGTLTDITERKALEERLAHQAFHDPLSGLPNRTLFLDRLRHALAWHERRNGTLAVLFLDLDNFKLINDSLGHHIGDRLLVAVAERLGQCLRSQDTAARLGGDEFTILLEDIATADDAIRVARRVQEQLQAPFALDGHELFASASIGIAVSTPANAQPEALLRDADTAMYRAKFNGKARLELFDLSMNERAMQRLELETDLRRAVTRNEFRVYYQPIVRLADGHVGELEALVRWEHPRRGLVPPAEFIPLAEETGLILPIGRFVLEQACRQLREWQTAFGNAAPLVLSVNLSARQFQNPDLEQEILQALRATGLSPASLKLEITESVMMQDAEATIRLVRKLKRIGIHLAIDDFGTGYSSLTYLQQFPIDILKIDRSFIDRIGKDLGTIAIIRAIITLARSLNLRVTAEGIETAAQLVELRALGCEQGQGYYFSPPLTADATQQLLAGQHASSKEMPTG